MTDPVKAPWLCDWIQLGLLYRLLRFDGQMWKSTHLLDTQNKLHKFPFLLNLPPIHLELYAFFLSLSLPTVNGSQFHITPRKLSRFQPNRLIMMCQCRFILGEKKKKKDTILTSDIANGGSYACVQGGIYMYFPLNFAVSLKLL